MNFKMRIFKAKTQLILESYLYQECLLFKVARVVGVHHSLQIWFMGATDGCVNPFVLFFLRHCLVHVWFFTLTKVSCRIYFYDPLLESAKKWTFPIWKQSSTASRSWWNRKKWIFIQMAVTSSKWNPSPATRKLSKVPLWVE